MKLLVVVLCALISTAACNQHDVSEKLTKLEFGMQWLNDMILGTVAPDADRLINQLELVYHPKFGMMNKMYHSDIIVNGKPAMTSFMRMMAPTNKTHWSKVENSDTLVLWHKGAPIRIHMIEANGTNWFVDMGCPIEKPHHKMQFLIKKNTWAFAEVLSDTDYSLGSTAVFPGITNMETDITLATVDEMINKFSSHFVENPILERIIRFQAKKKVSGYTRSLSGQGNMYGIGEDYTINQLKKYVMKNQGML